MTDTATPRNKAAERLYKTAPPWMRIYMEPDGHGLHCDDDDDVASFLSKFDAALAHERQQGREDAAKRVTARLIAEAMEDAIDHDDAARILRDAIASPSEEPEDR